MINKRAPPSADLLVCFPSRAHLALMPKPINSPIRSSDHNNKKNHFPRRHNHNHHYHRRGSPILWAKTKSTADISEPTSPKVTCAGQIKVRHKSKNNWQSVIEEIERLHGSNRKQSRRNSFLSSSVFKKEAVNFLTCLRGLRLNFRCLGAFSTSDMTSDDDEEEEDDDNNVAENRRGYEKERCDNSTIGPPPNALLLMRSRSAPAKNWPEESIFEEKEEEENSKKTNSLEAIMRHDIDFYMNSGDIVKETWLVGRPYSNPNPNPNPNPNARDQRLLQRSRSWKR